MVESINGSCKLTFKDSSGAKNKCRKEHIITSFREDPSYFTLHVWPNYLSLDRSFEIIGISVIGFANKR